MVEQLICNQQVAGSSPIASSATEAIKEDWAPNIYICATATYLEGFPSGQRDQTVNLASLTSKVRILPPPRNAPGGAARAGVAQLVELQPSKLDVAGSNPVSRSKLVPGILAMKSSAHLAQLVEHVLGKDEVTSSILVVGSTRTDAQLCFH
jgi:hypothetical protein